MLLLPRKSSDQIQLLKSSNNTFPRDRSWYLSRMRFLFILFFSMSSLAFISFVAGILTILAPCVLPVLPVILAGSLTEKKWWYPYVVTLSLALSIVIFTVLLKASTVFIDIPSSFWKYVSGGILIFLGAIYIFPHIWSKIVEVFRFSKASSNLSAAQDIGNPFSRAIVTGAVLGPVFSTCSPTYTLLLATIFPVSFIAGIGYTFIYALGLSLMLTIIAIG
jgi:cytochrome c-type biogenesis protein